MKKILKTAVVLLSAGIIATPAFAADWGVSGQVQVNWNVLNSGTEEVKPQSGTATKKNTDDQPGTGVAHGDTFVTFGLSGDNGSASMKYYANGNQDFEGTASVEEDGWTASVKATQRIGDDNGDVSKANSGRDNFVSVSSEGGLSLKMGHYTPLDSFRQGAGNLLQGEKLIKNLGGVSALDNKSSVSEIGFKVSDALNVGVAIEQGQKSFAFSSLSYGSYAPGDASSTSMNMGIKANFNTDALSVGFVYVTASKAALSEIKDEHKDRSGSAGGLGLGVKMNLGNITPYLNFFSPTITSEDKGSGNKSELSGSSMQLGADVGPFGVAYNTQSLTDTDTPTGGTKTETTYTNSAVELGYNGKLGATAFKVGFVSKNLETKEKDSDTTTTTSTNLRIRLQHNF